MLPNDKSISELLASLCDETISSAEMAQLDQKLRSDASARHQYFEYLDLHARLSFSGSVVNVKHAEKDESQAADADNPHSSYGVPQPNPPSPIPNLLLSPLPSSLSASSFVGGMLFSYLVATVIVGVGLTIAAFVQVSRSPATVQQLASNPPSSIPHPSRKAEYVGQITNMADCVLDNNDLQSVIRGQKNLKTPISVGDRFVVRSGLLEITYDSGAKVILQGPVTYKVDSAASGYLSIGKLTARMENKVANAGTQISKSPNLNPKPSPSPLFAVRTPTAIVTDLGTEFGVEVLESGITESHVFEGRVEVQRTDVHGKTLETVRLIEKEAVRIQGDAAPATRMPANPSRFAKMVSKPDALGLIARYKFDEIVHDLVLRVPDSSGHHRPGALLEMAQANLVACKFGKALEFNVAPNNFVERVQVPWSPSFDLADHSFTLAIWLNRQATGDKEHETILHKEGSKEKLHGGYSIMRERDSGRLMFRARNFDDFATLIRTTTSGDDAPEGVWVHFVVVGKYDASKKLFDITLLRNGIKSGGQCGVALATLPLPLSFGALENGWGFRGQLFDAQIYHRALSTDDVKYLAEHPGDLPPVSASNHSAIDQSRTH